MAVSLSSGANHQVHDNGDTKGAVAATNHKFLITSKLSHLKVCGFDSAATVDSHMNQLVISKAKNSLVIPGNKNLVKISGSAHQTRIFGSLNKVKISGAAQNVTISGMNNIATISGAVHRMNIFGDNNLTDVSGSGTTTEIVGSNCVSSLRSKTGWLWKERQIVFACLGVRFAVKSKDVDLNLKTSTVQLTAGDHNSWDRSLAIEDISDDSIFRLQLTFVGISPNDVGIKRRGNKIVVSWANRNKLASLKAEFQNVNLNMNESMSEINEDKVIIEVPRI